jgi:nucleotide-binding universal stress UspA family protein
VQAALGAEGVQVSGQLLEGRPDQAILAAAQANGADLIVVGSHGRTGLERMLMGSTSERILNQADCPVLVVKAA